MDEDKKQVLEKGLVELVDSLNEGVGFIEKIWGKEYTLVQYGNNFFIMGNSFTLPKNYTRKAFDLISSQGRITGRYHEEAAKRRAPIIDLQINSIAKEIGVEYVCA